jgi:hypothetical protein
MTLPSNKDTAHVVSAGRAMLLHGDVAHAPEALAPLLRDAAARQGPLSRVYVRVTGVRAAACVTLA